MNRVFISDCEGPISINDNAFEIAARYVPNGDRFFTVISRYDDVLADILKRPGDRAGNTLKFILPFLKAYGLTDREMQEFSAKSLMLLSSVEETVRHIRQLGDAFIVSTSYEHYIKAVCERLQFPFDRTFCTRVTIDKYRISTEEKARLKAFSREIAQMSIFNVHEGAEILEALTPDAQRAIRRLDEIFLKTMPEMESGKILAEVSPVGGSEKADAVKQVTKRLRVSLAEVMYVGDSITDEEALRLVKNGGGLAVSFNGNRYAVKTAEVAVLSRDTTVTAIIAQAFLKHGKKEALRLVEHWNRETLKNGSVSSSLVDRLFKLFPDSLPKVKITTPGNMETLARESCEFRKKVRGETIGRLG